MGHDVELHIIGAGPSRNKLVKKIPQCRFSNWVGRDRLAKYYQSADLLILPSRFETFGNVILEAMACGCPTAPYNCKGPKDIIEHGVNGFLAENLDDLIDLISEYIKNDETHASLSMNAISRGAEYEAPKTMEQLMNCVGLGLNSMAMSVSYSNSEKECSASA